MKNVKIYITVIIVFFIGTKIMAQVSGGPFEISKSTIANGGTKSSTNTSSYELKGSIGQNIAHNYSSGSTYKITGGFWSPGAPAELIFSNGFETLN